jgi:heavy metal sensor kinase
MNLPIRVRLTLWYSALLATIIVSLGTFLVLQLRADLREAIDDEVRTNSGAIVHAVADETQESVAGEPADVAGDASAFQDAARASLPLSSGAQVLDERGQVLARYGAVAAAEPLVTTQQQRAALAGASRTFTGRLGDEGQRYRVKATAFRDRGQVRILVVALSLQRVEEMVQRVLVLLLIAGPVALAAATLAAYWLARKSLRPVEQMTSDAQEIGTGRLHERVALPAAHDEIGHLAVTLNAMLDRIERGVTDRHRLVADASHELRTPLAVMRAELDVSLRADELPPAAREVLESVGEEVDRMRRTVDNLLALAEADEGRLELLTVRVSLRQAIEDAARPLRLLAAAKEVSLRVEGGRWEAQADPQRLHLALTNLIENAIKFTPPGGSVHVTSWRHEGEVGVAVSDEGPGIAAEDREHLFDRYYRVDSARGHNIGGSGLGLAICREVALAHGGRLWVDSELGGGSVFSLALPSWRALQTREEPSAPSNGISGSRPVAPTA